MEGSRRRRAAEKVRAQSGVVRERGHLLLEEAAERSRPSTVAERLRANWLWITQAALATSVAWVLAKELFGHPRPIFAPAERASSMTASTSSGVRAL